MKFKTHTGILLFSWLGLVTTALGAGAPTVPESFRACARKQDVLQRLSCYDAEMTKLDGPQAAPTPAAAGTPAPIPVPAAPTPAPAKAAGAPAAIPPATGLGSEQLRNAPARPLGEEQLRAPVTPSSSTSSLMSSLKFWKSKEPKPAKETDAGMTARIDALRKNASGLYVVTLDNGQVWRQLETDENFPLESGDTVRIDRGAMGSYRLMPVREGWKRWTRVSRLQ